MSIDFVRYADGEGSRWGVVHGGLAVSPLPSDIVTTADVLSEGVRVAKTISTDPVELATLRLLPPTPDARVVCQGANYRSHMIESGMDPDRSFNMLFTKSTASLSGPDDDIVRPGHVQLLDYEVELGIVIGKAITAPTTITDDTLADYVGGFVVANDVSARDIQLPEGQWYKGKSYRTFCPVGPWLSVPTRDEVARWRELRLTLHVNGSRRQDGLAGEMAFAPSETLTEVSQLEDLAVGDLLLTGTPGGVAMQPPPTIVQRIGGLLPDAKRWQIFVKRQAGSSKYLRPGDQVTAGIRTDDGALDLGTQHTTVR